MKSQLQILLSLALLATALCVPPVGFLSRHRRDLTVEEQEAIAKFLREEYEPEASAVCYRQVVAEWDFATDVNNADKEQAQINQTLVSAAYDKAMWEQHFRGLNGDDFIDKVVGRQIESLSVLGNAALDTDKLEMLTVVGTQLTNIYSTGRICPYDKQNCNIETEGLTLDPDIEAIIAKSTNYDELTYAWKGWRDATGAKMRTQYQTYVDLSNEAARANNFSDKGALWRSDYDSETFEQDMDALWQEVRPLYDELHFFVMNKLKERYGDAIDISDGLIPANILGNMWAQSWINLKDFLKPYPNAPEVDVTGALNAQGYDAFRMFETSNEFYLSLGLEDNSMCYNVSDGAVIEKPPDRDILCHASAWDFCDKKTFRVKMCTKINFEDFVTIHHEMGHIQYYLLYKDQPISLRTGANPGFHEAVGDTIALSVSTPQHLEKIGLLQNYEDTPEAGINALMDMALERVAFLPFGLLIDKWRWDVFSGKITSNEWNAQWWHYRQTIQKVKPPVSRSENDFDPGAKYHIPGDSQYIAYFVAHILEFQLHRSLCIAANQYVPGDETRPLYKCDIYQSREAGNLLRDGLSLGASQPWPVALEAMTGETKLSGSAILEYFDPLYKYLIEQNQKHRA